MCCSSLQSLGASEVMACLFDLFSCHFAKKRFLPQYDTPSRAAFGIASADRRFPMRSPQYAEKFGRNRVSQPLPECRTCGNSGRRSALRDGITYALCQAV